MKYKENDGNLDNRIFIGGLSWEITERQLENTFERFGEIIECQIMVAKATGRPRGFGFITFADPQGADDAIKHMQSRELGDKAIYVSKAEPKAEGDDVGYFHKGEGYSSRGQESYGGAPAAEDECFKCGRPGHWARECPSTGGGRRGFRDIYSRTGGYDEHRNHFGYREQEQVRYRDRYIDERRDGGRYNYRDSYENGYKYEIEDHYGMERYGMAEDYPENDYGRRERRGYDRDKYSRGASDKYGAMGPFRDEGRAYRSRPGPYDRPKRSGSRPSSSHRR